MQHRTKPTDIFSSFSFGSYFLFVFIVWIFARNFHDIQLRIPPAAEPHPQPLSLSHFLFVSLSSSRSRTIPESDPVVITCPQPRGPTPGSPKGVQTLVMLALRKQDLNSFPLCSLLLVWPVRHGHCCSGGSRAERGVSRLPVPHEFAPGINVERILLSCTRNVNVWTDDM